MRTLIIISDNTSRRVYKLDDTDSNNILELAMVYGRGESGEVIFLEDDDHEIANVIGIVNIASIVNVNGRANNYEGNKSNLWLQGS